MLRMQQYIMAAVLAAVMGLPALATAQQSYAEDFTTTTYKDAVNTNADWNTADGELKLFPFEMTLTGSVGTPGIAYNVFVSGDHAYVADASGGLQVIDISDPAAPASVGFIGTPDEARGVFVDGNYAFVGAVESGLRIIDVTDPAAPVDLGNVDTPVAAYGVWVSGDYAYVAAWFGGIQVIDVSDPAAPAIVGNLATANFTWDVVVDGDHAFVACDIGGLRIADISDPTNPVMLGTANTPGSAAAVAVDGDHAFVADSESGLQVIDVSDPASPVIVGSVDTPSAASDVWVSGDRLYVADLFGGFAQIDITDPTAPVILQTVSTPGPALGVMVAGEHAFVAQGAGLQVVRITSPLDTPLAVGSYATSGDCLGVAVAGDHAYLPNYQGPFQVIDVSDPSNPVLVGSCVMPGDRGWDVFVAGNHAIVALSQFGNNGLVLIDISDPTSPTVTGSLLSLGSQTRSVTVSGDLAFLANSNTLIVIDISDPTSPAVVGSWDPSGAVHVVFVAGDHAFVGHGTYLSVLDISDPTSPIQVGSFNTGDQANGVFVAGDHAFVANNTLLTVLDISDPTSPVLAGSHGSLGYANAVEVAGDRAFVADNYDGLHVFDISDPTNPALVTTVNTAGPRVAVAGDHAFVAGSNDGLRVIRVQQGEVDANQNAGQSLIVHGGSDSIQRVRLASTETAGVTWELSADAGTTWQTFAADGAWTTLTVPGTDLLWRTTHDWAPGLNPTVSDLTLEWLYENGAMATITDVPDDQGGWVRVEFTRSAYDFADETGLAVTGYQVYRRVDDAATAMRILEDGDVPSVIETEDSGLASFEPGSLRTLGDRTFLVGGAKAQGEFPPGTWEFLTWVGATQSETYIGTVPTLADSTAQDGIAWSTYLVTTHTTTPSVWFASQPDSGYSVDNIAPGVPQALVADYQSGGVSLDWDDAPEADFQFHRIYRGTSADFEPAPENVVHETAGSAWTDDTADPWNFHYKVTTLDHAGNESEAAAPSGATGVDSGTLPPRTALLDAYPNPFNPSTKLSFELAAPGHARLRIYDAAGRLVTTLVDEARPAGRHEQVWDGRDASGRQAASGVYLYRLEAGTKVQTRRMTLVK